MVQLHQPTLFLQYEATTLYTVYTL